MDRKTPNPIIYLQCFPVQSYPWSCLNHPDCREDLAIIWFNLIKIDGKSNNTRHNVTQGVDFICVDITTAKLLLQSLLILNLPSCHWILFLPFS